MVDFSGTGHFELKAYDCPNADNLRAEVRIYDAKRDATSESILVLDHCDSEGFDEGSVISHEADGGTRPLTDADIQQVQELTESVLGHSGSLVEFLEKPSELPLAYDCQFQRDPSRTASCSYSEGLGVRIKQTQLPGNNPDAWVFRALDAVTEPNKYRRLYQSFENTRYAKVKLEGKWQPGDNDCASLNYLSGFLFLETNDPDRITEGPVIEVILDYTEADNGGGVYSLSQSSPFFGAVEGWCFE